MHSHSLDVLRPVMQLQQKCVLISMVKERYIICGTVWVWLRHCSLRQYRFKPTFIVVMFFIITTMHCMEWLRMKGPWYAAELNYWLFLYSEHSTSRHHLTGWACLPFQLCETIYLPHDPILCSQSFRNYLKQNYLRVIKHNRRSNLRCFMILRYVN